ncbi:MAG: ABC transporter permease [Bacteroidaceae bacterium]|nr:ABC transporter permease [Bacteroidaceae bacterium]
MRQKLFIARRLFGHREDAGRVSRPAITIAVCGVAVGLAIMILSVCIVLGFKDEIRNKVMGFGGQAQILNYESLYNSESFPVVVDETMLLRLSRVPGVVNVQRFCTKAGMLKTNDSFNGVMFHGVAEEYDTVFLAEHLVEGVLPQFRADTTGNQILISRIQASKLGLSVGDKVYTYFFNETARVRRFNVVGIYDTHLTDFDQNIVFTDLYVCRKLNGWESDQCSGAELLLADKTDDGINKVVKSLIGIVNRTTDHYGATYSATAITELYPGIFAWLSLLDTNVWVILVLMLGIGLFTMISGILIVILERTSFIAIMKSIGAPDSALRTIFLNFGAMLVGRGIIYGSLFGVGLALLQGYSGLVHLDPATYYVESVPIKIPWLLIGLLVLVTFLISVIVLIIPTMLVSRIHPAQVMRFE